jgi:hypothetical protein
MRGHVTQHEQAGPSTKLLQDMTVSCLSTVHWQCHSINSHLPLALNAAAASNTLQVGVSLWVMGAWLPTGTNNQIRLNGCAQ